ncbi:ATP-binding protein [Actinoplanes sp. NPDC051411]|uniref:ATP-binding protein n=1 Tax=Actinoplanes sp. NPDC051411 TaxID=3155522 RepID=UPI0034188BEA
MAVECAVTGDESGLVATLTGRLALADAAQVRVWLFKCLAEQPDALFVDVAGLTVEEPLALAVFSAVNRQAARWPGIPVLYCGPAQPVRDMLARGAYRRLPVADTVAQARGRAGVDGLTVPSLIDDLLPLPGAPRQARDVATEACLRWDLPDLVGAATVIASELVTNVVDHAGTMATMRISLRPRFVTIGVRDGSTVEPRRGTPGPYGGRGLLLVEAMAHSWGWLPVDGGKVVWASLSR